MPDEQLPAPIAPQPEPSHTPPVPVRWSGRAVQPADMAPPPAFGPAEGEPDWAAYLGALLAHKWIIIGATVAGTILGILASRFVPPVYTAEATIWIDVANPKEQTESPFWTGRLSITGSWDDLLKSHAVLDGVVRQLHLYVSYNDSADSLLFAGLDLKDRFRPGVYTLRVGSKGQGFTLLTDQNQVVQRGAPGDSVGTALGFLWQPPAAAFRPGLETTFTVDAPSSVAQSLALSLKSTTDAEGNFLSVELGGPNPTEVTTTVNAVAEQFVAVAADLKNRQLRELTRILATQLTQARAHLASAEASLQNFRTRTVTFLSQDAQITPDPSSRDPMFNSFFDTRVTLDQVKQDRAAIEAVLATVPDSGLNVSSLEMIGAVQRSSELTTALRDLTAKQAELRALQLRYTDANPQVQRAAQDVRTMERQNIPALARNLITSLRAREAELTSQVEAVRSDLRQVPQLTIEGARLQREVTLAEQIAANLQTRYEEARLAEVSSIPDVRMLDRAVEPDHPSGHARPIIILLAMMASFGLTSAGVILRDRFDTKVRRPAQVSREMGLQVLGVVPRAGKNGSGENGPQVVEAIRGIRLGLVHAYGSAGPLILTVTSPGKSDGKSFVSSNLALSFANAGVNTLLIDADIRRGRLHHVLNVPRRPGLTDYLSGEATREQVVHPTGYAGLTFIPCGARVVSGPELLGSPNMTWLLTSLRANYGAIIVDSPPLAAGIDAYGLGTLTGNILLVMRTGVTDLGMAGAKLEALDRLPIRVLGAVLNDVKEGGGYDYYAYYMPGYEVKSEEPEEKVAAAQRVLRGGEEDPDARAG